MERRGARGAANRERHGLPRIEGHRIQERRLRLPRSMHFRVLSPIRVRPMHRLLHPGSEARPTQEVPAAPPQENAEKGEENPGDSSRPF